ncbi:MULTISPECIES: hypothetical protein, partial [unclassified Nostoc]|uniref:hypothetical protein n=1 Tax=unclassified Nostoc TaxID=2593658 RepID=UPI0025EB1CEE
RMRVLQTYAAIKDKTITSLVEDWIDSLNSEKVRWSIPYSRAFITTLNWVQFQCETSAVLVKFCRYNIAK